MTTEQKTAFDAVVQEALKKMQEVASTSVSSSYEVHRAKGEVVVTRSDYGSAEKLVSEKKTGTHG